MKSGIQQLREEKYRFTVETQGLNYTTKDHRLSVQDADKAWTDDDSDHEAAPIKGNSHLAQRMATELTRVLQQGGSRGVTEDTLERFLAGSLQSGSDAAGYGAAKDYIKQVLGQLYGNDELASSNLGGTASDSRVSGVQVPADAAAAPTEHSDGGARWLPEAAPTAPPSRIPPQYIAQTAAGGLTAPPWTVAVARGSSAGAGTGITAASSAGGAVDDLERPRPRPHHGRIKEQLDLLQNADQLAAIISVATTAATTAAAAAVKQTMQTPPPLPPGAYARMHAAGQAVYGLPVSVTGTRLPQPSTAGAAAPDGIGDDSPDPQPQQRQGALVSPHRRSTPMVMLRRQETDTRAMAAAEANASQVDGQQFVVRSGPTGSAVPVPSSEDAQLRRQRLRWSQRRGVPLGPASPGALDDREAAGPADANFILTEDATSSAAAAAGAPANSNLRVVRLGVPRVTARTPTPVRPRPVAGDMRPHHVNQTDAAAAVHAEVRMAIAESTPLSGEEVGPADGGRGVVPWGQRPDAPARHTVAAGDRNQLGAPAGGVTAAAVAKGPGLQHVTYSTEDSDASRQPPGAQIPALASDVPAEGLYVTGGESIFAKAQAMAATGGAASGQQAARGGADSRPSEPRRSVLPEDVRDAFRSTLAFIADPDGARAQQHQPPTWAALADVEERKEAQREAEELLGGAFDYATVKRGLESARRASRLMQQAGAPVGPPPALAGAAAGAGGSALKFGGGRGRPGPEAAASLAAAGPAAKAVAPRGDFAGLLPPPHSVWDVDEAWLDLDEFTKVVEAEVAYRAAASAAGPSGRGSPGPKPVGAAAHVSAAGQTVQTGRAGPRLPGGRATVAAGTTAMATGSGQEQGDASARSTGRKRAASPGHRTAALSQATAAAAETTPSPPRAVRKAPASGPVRVAFGRRVDEPPKVAEPGAFSKLRSGSPPAARGSPNRIRTRVRKAAGAPAATTTAAPPTPSSTGDAVHQVLSALASVLLSDGDDGDDNDGGGVAATRDVEALHGADDGLAGLGDVVTRRETREAETQADAVEALPFPPTGAPEPRAVPLQFPFPPGTAVPADWAAAAVQREQQWPPAGPSPGLPPDAPMPTAASPSGQEADRQSMASAPGTLPAAGGVTAAVQPPWMQPGLQPWPNTAGTARPRFQYVVDTAHPPVTRLPAWAASAAAAEGAPTAYAAAMGAAPTGLGFGTPTRRRPPPSASATPTAMPSAAPVAPQPFDAIGMVVPQAARGGRNFAAMTNTSVLHSGQMQQPQQQAPPQQQQFPQPVFLAPADLPVNTRVLPPEAAAAAVAAAAADTPAASRRAADPGQQWEKALLQAVEDEVVGRLAAVQLAAQGGALEVTPQSLPGMVPPLVDLELSRRLVCDVLRENLRALMMKQRHQGAVGAQEAPGVPTLEEVVAALAAAPVLPPRLQQSQGQQEAAIPAAAQAYAFPADQQQQYDSGEGPETHPGFSDAAIMSDGAAALPGADVPSGVIAAQAESAHWQGRGAESVGGAGVDMNSTSVGGMAEQGLADAGDESARPQSAGTSQVWHPVYAGQRGMQASQATQAAPDTSAAAVQANAQGAASLVQRQDAPTIASSEDLAMTWPGHGSSGTQDSPGSPVATSAAPATGLSEPFWAPAQQPGPAAVASMARAVAAGEQRRSPLGFAVMPKAPALPGAAVTSMVAAVADLNDAPQSVDPGALIVVQQSPNPSQGVQAHGVQVRGVQAHGAEDRGVQAYGIVMARATQAHGTEARGTQAAGMQERATQAAGVMNSSSQADPPLPHYLLQAALAAGLSYGSGPPQPTAAANMGFCGVQPMVGPDGAPVTMPRPFYLVPADNTQLPSALGAYGAGSGLPFPQFSRGEGNRPPLNIPGLSKLRDSSDVESSTDSMGRHLQGPGARTRAAALEALRLASRISLDSDDGLLQRSYAYLELAALSARPVRLDQHRVSTESSQTVATETAQPRARREGPHPLAPSDLATSAAGSAAGGGSGSGASGSHLTQGDAGGQPNKLGLESQVAVNRSGHGGIGAPTYLTQGTPGHPSHSSAAASQGASLDVTSQRTLTSRAPSAVGEAGNTAASSPALSATDAPDDAAAAASRVSSFADSAQTAASGRPWQGGGAGHGSAGGAAGAVSAPATSSRSASAGESGLASSREASAVPSAGLSHAASRDSIAASAAGETLVAGQDTPAHGDGPAGTAGHGAAAEPSTPAVADDELVGDEGFTDDDGQVHSVHFESSEEPTDLMPVEGGNAAAVGDTPTTEVLHKSESAASSVAASAASAAASRAGSKGHRARGRSDAGDQGSASPLGGQAVWSDVKASASAGGGAGRRYGDGAGEAGDFALSDDELLDDAEVTRVLEEEDGKSAEETEEELLSEDDDELQRMEGQVTVLEDSDEECEAVTGGSAYPGAANQGEQGADDTEPLARQPDGVRIVQGDSGAGGEGVDLAAAGGDDSRAASRQASAMHTAVQSRAGSVASSATSADPPASTGVLLAIGHSTAGQRESGSGADGEDMRGGTTVSDRSAVSVSGGSRASQPAASASLRGLSPRGSSGAVHSYVPSIGTQGPTDVDVENRPAAGAGSNTDDDFVALRASMERLAVAGLAPLGRLQSATGSGGSGLTRATVAPSLASSQQQPQSVSGRTGAAQLPRPALAPLQPSAVQSAASASESGGASQLPGSPSKPPSLANYHGPMRQLWRPSSAQAPQDPLMSSSETLMASSEASGPALGPLSRALLEGQRRGGAVGPGSRLTVAAERVQALGLADSIAETSLEVSESTDSVPALSVSQQGTLAGIGLPRELASGVQPRGARGDAVSSGLDSEADSDEEGSTPLRTAAAGLGRALQAGRGSSRRDGAVFRLRQYGARRRKLLQQIGVTDPLLLSSATSLSTDSSAVSDSEDGDGYAGLSRAGATAAMRRM